MKSKHKHATIGRFQNTTPQGPDMVRLSFHDFKKNLFFIIGISVAILYIYHPTFSFEFINFDDQVYVTDNEAVKSGINPESIVWAFGIHKDICMYYQPVAWLAHMLDVEIWGLDPGGHHVSGVVVHLINVILLFLVLKTMTRSFIGSALAASLFALHPVNADAVSWIAERKTLVSGFFWLSGMWAYLFYTQKPGLPRYLLSLALFTLGLLTKPVMVTFPCVLLLLDIWPLQRMAFRHSMNLKTAMGLFKEKIPFFVITALWFITPFLSPTLLSNETPASVIPHGLRIANALVAYVKYVMKFVVPVNLSILYPFPKTVPLFQSLSSLVVLVSATCFLAMRYKKAPYLIIGWLWFLGTLFPTSGLILGTLWPSMADRWAYIPYVGLCIMTAWTMESLIRRTQTPCAVPAIALTYLAFLGWTLHHQVGHWQNSQTIFEHALSVIEYHPLPHQNIAGDMIKKGRFDKAKYHLEVILKHEPDNKEAHYNMGLLFDETGDVEKALFHLTKAKTLDPRNDAPVLSILTILKRQNRTAEALALCEDAAAKVKRQDRLLFQQALLLFESDQKEASELKLMELLSSYPAHLEGLVLYGDLLFEKKDTAQARAFYQKALALSPVHPRAIEGLNRCGNGPSSHF